MGHMMMNGFLGHGWAMGFGWIFWLLLLAGVIWLISRILMPGGNGSAGTALAILEEWYARGEITAEELKQMERNLRS